MICLFAYPRERYRRDPGNRHVLASPVAGLVAGGAEARKQPRQSLARPCLGILLAGIPGRSGEPSACPGRGREKHLGRAWATFPDPEDLFIQGIPVGSVAVRGCPNRTSGMYRFVPSLQPRLTNIQHHSLYIQRLDSLREQRSQNVLQQRSNVSEICDGL